MNSLQKRIEEIFADAYGILFGFTEISYSDFGQEFPYALIFAVPYTHRITLKDYRENLFHEGILGAKQILEEKVDEIETLLKEEGIPYYVPEVAQKDDGLFRAEFSFKDAAASAGIGWFGKNDVIITEKYGPRVRLSAILIDHDFECGNGYQNYIFCGLWKSNYLLAGTAVPFFVIHTVNGIMNFVVK